MSVGDRSRKLLLLVLLVSAPAYVAGPWKTLDKDELHDPSNPALKLLQQPGDALSVLAPATGGNRVDWVAAVRKGQIAPRHSLDGAGEKETRETTIIMRNTLGFLPVTFPHEAHSMWMSCEMCHDSIFIPEVNANDITMVKILEGEYCGVCHGAVSFPLTECNRCHAAKRLDVLLQENPGANGDIL